MVSAGNSFSLVRPALVGNLRFSGEAATRAAEGKWLSTGTMRGELEKDVDPYLGKLPGELMALTGRSEKETMIILDKLAAMVLRRFKKRFPTEMDFKYGVCGLNGSQRLQDCGDLKELYFVPNGWQPQRNLRIIAVGAGFSALAYRLDVPTAQGMKHFLFKVFWDPDQDEFMASGPYKEAANGLYLTRRHAGDAAKFIAGNPSARWHLMEYVDPDAPPPPVADGPTCEDLGFGFDDDLPKNRIHGKRVDMGEMYRAYPREVCDPDDPNCPDFIPFNFSF